MASDSVRSRILAAGQRITPQRDLVAEVLEQADRPLSAQELLAAVEARDRRIGRATVFRTLQSLQEAGIVQQVPRPGGQGGYLLCATSGHHHHLVCQRCGRVEDLPEEEVAAFVGAVARDHGFAVDHASFELSGTCAACR
ncbi:Fur family transcriptional regulator [Aciditerrimonas ferrireducens]|uniref:Fur family transcriptional regulator n=1 Tax=Aciditerrimonas ferrireducens TaxID=667306 RepID=UPI002004B559|nr:Fur family transcriptional regulator [Aciditerrimonas ferrireducens]MCK4177800.1 transcriptional repressor [Aciditerrimonas ferrireducens]